MCHPSVGHLISRASRHFQAEQGNHSRGNEENDKCPPPKSGNIALPSETGIGAEHTRKPMILSLLFDVKLVDELAAGAVGDFKSVPAAR